MDQINSEILRQLENEGLKINKGITIDARLVKSASRPLRNDEINKLREQKIQQRANSIKMASRLSSHAIWIQTGASL